VPIAESGRGDSAFQSWLYRITVNVVRTHLTRCRVGDAALPDSATDSERLEEIPDTGHMESALARRQAIDRALASLSEESRTLIVLRDV
jgi:RNA polymerase sigma-70 factor (ECF subfamily)